MYNHSGSSWDFLKLFLILLFIGVAVWWLNGAIGANYTLLIIFALVGVILFAGGALFAHANQKMTLGAITKFNADDAQIDKFRMQSFKAMAQGESAMQRAAAQMTVIDAKRVDKLADQRARLLLSDARQQAQPEADAWTWDDDDTGVDGGNDAMFQNWR
jgi:hypothetical protein